MSTAPHPFRPTYAAAEEEIERLTRERDAAVRIKETWQSGCIACLGALVLIMGMTLMAPRAQERRAEPAPPVPVAWMPIGPRSGQICAFPRLAADELAHWQHEPHEGQTARSTMHVQLRCGLSSRIEPALGMEVQRCECRFAADLQTAAPGFQAWEPTLQDEPPGTHEDARP